MKLTELKGKKLIEFPLYLRKIYFIQLTSLDEELKIMIKSTALQSTRMRDSFPTRQISKTVDKRLFTKK